jgi:hypothetical protein
MADDRTKSTTRLDAHILALVVAAGLDKALAEFPDDVLAAASSAMQQRDSFLAAYRGAKPASVA